MLNKRHQARWISKTRAHAVRKSIAGAGAMLLASFKGMIVVEPVGAGLGDGRVLSPPEADYELQPAWCTEAKTKVSSARKLLGLAS